MSEQVTIIMPVYNPGEYLRPCLDSLLAQSMKDFRIIAIDDGQFKAAKVLGLSNSYTFLHITLPQCVRNSLPSISNEVLNLVKDTSLITILGASELLKAGRNAVNHYATATPFIFVAIFYLVMTFVITRVMNFLEKRSSYYE